MAASLSPCASNRSLAFCSCTSCALQNGHKSAERTKSRTVPVVPCRVSFDCLFPNWSFSVNGGAFSPTSSPKETESVGCVDCPSVNIPGPRAAQTTRTAIQVFFILGDFLRFFSSNTLSLLRTVFSVPTETKVARNPAVSHVMKSTDHHSLSQAQYQLASSNDLTTRCERLSLDPRHPLRIPHAREDAQLHAGSGADASARHRRQ